MSKKRQRPDKRTRAAKAYQRKVGAVCAIDGFKAVSSAHESVLADWKPGARLWGVVGITTGRRLQVRAGPLNPGTVVERTEMVPESKEASARKNADLARRWHKAAQRGWTEPASRG